jgi:hypothetical protein
MPVDQAQLESWKQQHPRGVQEITVTVAAADLAVGYLKPADRNLIAVALSKVTKNQILEAGEFLLQNCWLGGDPRMNPAASLADDDVIVAAAMQAASTVNILDASVKKL